MMPIGGFSTNTVRRAIVWGASYWSFYGAVDYFLSDTLPSLLERIRYVPDSSYWNTGLLALLIMIGGGTVLGAAAGLLCGRGGAALSVIAVFAAVMGASSSPGLSALLVSLAVPLALAAAVLWVHLDEERARRFWFLTNPATLSLALIVRPWLYRDVLGSSPRLWQLIASGLALLAIVGVSWVFRRAISARWIGYAAVGLGVLSIAGGFGIRSRPHLAASGSASPAAGKPNVILITMDTVRADHLSVYGYERDTTPNLRRFAAAATVYRRAISAANWTAPSHASIFTGMYTLRHGVRFDVPNPKLGKLPDAAPTLAETLAHQGYRTAGLAANHPYLSDALGFGRGFGFYGLPMPWAVFEYSRYPSVLRWIRGRLLPSADNDMIYVHGGMITAEALGMIEQFSRSQPFFLFLNYMDAHWPYYPPEPFRRRFVTPSRSRNSQEFTQLLFAVDRGERGIAASEKHDLEGAYDGGIAYLDDQLGVLFDGLRRAGVYDGALIIVTSDHGEAFGEKSLMSHGTSVYQDQVHVPLLIKYPGQREPAEVDALASGVDLYPTIMEAIGAPAGRYLAGAPVQRLSGLLARAVFTESYQWPGNNIPHLYKTERAMFRNSWKLILSTDGQRELYDLAADAGESSNVIAKQPGVAAEMEAVLSAWQKNLAPVNAPSGFDEATVNRLKSLGYVQ